MKSELILDQASVASSEGVTFHLNQAEKNPQNPVLLPGLPDQWDGLQISWPATVLYSPADKKFRCWYSGLGVVQSPGRWWVPGYAESEDGIHWIKPDLSEMTARGSTGNQVRCPWDPYALISTVFENPLPDFPESERFCAFWKEQGFDEQGQRDNHYLRAALAYSSDGIVWKRAGTAYEGIPFDRPSFQDISQVLYDKEEPSVEFRVKGYSQIFSPRAWDDFVVRKIGLVHGSKFDSLKDAEPPVVLEPINGVDEEIHFASVKKTGGNYLMLFESDRFSQNPIYGDLRLAVSKDGRNFRRIHEHSSLVATGVKGMWDENLLVTTTTALQEVGDEILIFYIGCPNVYTSWPIQYASSPDLRGSFFYPTCLGLATIPRDRYAFARGPGSLTTLPSFEVGNDLWLNADGNDIEVIAWHDSGKKLASGYLGSDRFKTVYRKVVWERSLPVSKHSVRITLGEGCKLYSWGMSLAGR